jgi:hypothetical protein
MSPRDNLTRRNFRLLPVLVAVALVASGCGGDPETGETVAPGPQSPGVTVDRETTTTAETSVGPTTSAATDTTGAGSSGSEAPTTTMAGAPTTTQGTATTTSSSTTTTTTTSAPTSTTEAVPAGPFVRIGKDYYPFSPDDCYVFDEADVLINGIGEAPDGSPVWVQFDANTNSGIWAMRIDIGTDDPFEDMEDHWVSGIGTSDDMVVTVDGQVVTATGTFVSGLGYLDTEGEFEAECG